MRGLKAKNYMQTYRNKRLTRIRPHVLSWRAKLVHGCTSRRWRISTGATVIAFSCLLAFSFGIFGGNELHWVSSAELPSPDSLFVSANTLLNDFTTLSTPHEALDIDISNVEKTAGVGALTNRDHPPGAQEFSWPNRSTSSRKR